MTATRTPTGALITPNADLREAFLRDGYVVVPGVLDDDLRQRLIMVTDRVVAAQLAEHTSRHKTTGSMVQITSDPVYVDLVTLPSAIEALARLGYPTPSFSDGWVISKPAGGPRLFWHYDWFTWQDDASLGREPCQISMMYYLNSTRVQNGCLRVLPGSHNTHNPMHDVLSSPRGDLSAGTNMDSPEFTDRPDEVDVPITAGDVLITDARLLHAGHPNTTTERRRLVTLWYQPDPAGLPERMLAQLAGKRQAPPSGWPVEYRRRLESILVRYDGHAVAYEPAPYRRLPDPEPAKVRS